MNPASSRLTKVRLLGALPWPALAAVAFAVFGTLFSPWFFVGTAILVLVIGWLSWLIPAQVRNLGWQETGDELLLTKGSCGTRLPWCHMAGFSLWMSRPGRLSDYLVLSMCCCTPRRRRVMRRSGVWNPRRRMNFASAWPSEPARG